jgi:hypothetical protein
MSETESNSLTRKEAFLDAFLKQYDEDSERRRQQEQARLRDPFVPWDEVRKWLKCSDTVWQRIRRLNPDHRGLKAYTMPRGLHRHKRLSQSINMDIIGPKKFIETYGREAYRSIPPEAFYHQGHQKALTMNYVMDRFLARPARTPA